MNLPQHEQFWEEVKKKAAKDLNKKSSRYTASVISETTITENLRRLLIKSLENQVENRERQAQLRNCLLLLATVVEQFTKTCPTQDRYSPCDLNEKITVSTNSFIQCKSDLKSQSLVVLHDKRFGENFFVPPNTALSRHRLLDVPISQIIPKGGFGAECVLYTSSKDKAVQSMLEPPSMTASTFIQTQMLSLSSFDIPGFKINLIRHMRSLRQDVVTLRQLLYGVDGYHRKDGFDRRRVLGINSGGCWRDDRFDCKFFQSKIRATNFVKFYKLRKGNNKSRRNLTKKDA